MDNETKGSLLNSIRLCISDLNFSDSALNIVRDNLQTVGRFQDEYSVTHLAIENLKQVRHMLNDLEQEYL